MYETLLQDFHMRMIMDSGQNFRIRRLPDGSFLTASQGRTVRISQEGERVSFSCSEKEFQDLWWDYFDLGRDYGTIKGSIDPADAFLTAAAAHGSGIRILRQDLWETIISFLISQNNNIGRIRNSIEALCARFAPSTSDLVAEPSGRDAADGPASPGPYLLPPFPTPEALCSGGLEGLQGLGLGYRDRYILRMAQRCCGPAGEQWLAEVRHSDYAAAMELLLREYGIGRKVADCICLFALHHVDAFPVDTHIRQILARHYPDGFPFDRYEGCAGILQQYMFFYQLSKEQ